MEAGKSQNKRVVIEKSRQNSKKSPWGPVQQVGKIFAGTVAFVRTVARGTETEMPLALDHSGHIQLRIGDKGHFRERAGKEGI